MFIPPGQSDMERINDELFDLRRENDELRAMVEAACLIRKDSRVDDRVAWTPLGYWVDDVCLNSHDYRDVLKAVAEKRNQDTEHGK